MNTLCDGLGFVFPDFPTLQDLIALRSRANDRLETSSIDLVKEKDEYENKQTISQRERKFTEQ